MAVGILGNSFMGCREKEKTPARHVKIKEIAAFEVVPVLRNVAGKGWKEAKTDS